MTSSNTPEGDSALSPVLYRVLMSVHANASEDVQRALDAHLAAMVAESEHGGPPPGPELLAAINRASVLRDEVAARLGLGHRPEDPEAAALFDRRRLARVQIEQGDAERTLEALGELSRRVGPFPPKVVEMVEAIRVMARTAGTERVAVAARLERLEAEIEGPA